MKIINTLEKAVVYLIIFLFLLLIIPSFPAAFILPREILIAGGTGVLLLLWSIKLIAKGSLSFSIGKFDLPILVLLLAYLASAIIKSPNKMEAFWLPGNATFIIASCLFYFLINQLNKADKEKAGLVLYLSATVYALLVLSATTGLLAKIPQLPEIIKTNTFNALGNNLQSTIVLAAITPLVIGLIIKSQDFAKRLFLAVTSIIIIFGLLVSVKETFFNNNQGLGILDANTSWQISVETLKNSPFLGIGPGNYLTAFRRFRPLSFNQTNYWTNYFTTGGNFYLTVLTEAGLLAGLALILLLTAVYKFSLKSFFKNTDNFALIILLVLAFFFPFSSPVILLLFILLALISGSEDKTVNSIAVFSSRMSSCIIALPIIILVATTSYFGSRYLTAEFAFKKALDNLVKNDAKTTFNALALAVKLNPQVDRYHSSYAQISLAMAQNLAVKKDLTDTDRNIITQLIQLSIGEAKASVALNPSRSDSWSLLANIYRSIMAFAQGADTFAVQSTQQTIALDPVNPNLRVSLGGIFYALGRYDEAIDAFTLATLAKPDLANAHYNLAIALREKGEIKKATDEMNTVLSLVGKNSADWETAKKELEKLESLTSPQPVEKPAIKPLIEL